MGLRRVSGGRTHTDCCRKLRRRLGMVGAVIGDAPAMHGDGGPETVRRTPTAGAGVARGDRAATRAGGVRAGTGEDAGYPHTARRRAADVDAVGVRRGGVATATCRRTGLVRR